MGEDLTVEVIKQLPLAVVAIIACIALWRKLDKRTDEHVEDLRKQVSNEHVQNKENLGEVRARLMVVEDNLHINRQDRIKYLPTTKMPTGIEIKDLD